MLLDIGIQELFPELSKVCANTVPIGTELFKILAGFVIAAHLWFP